MAYKKVYRKKRPFKKRVYRRKPLYRNRLTTKQAFPQTMMANLKYFSQLTLDPTGSTTGIASYPFRANDCYDPDASLGGHQPMGFDQYMAIYGRFHVAGSKITVKVLSGDAAPLNSSVLVGILRSSSQAVPTLISNLVENDKCVYRGYQLGDTSKPLIMKYSTRKAQGISKLMDNQELSGTSGTSPSIIDYFNIWASTVGTGNDPQPVQLQIHLQYSVVFSDPIQLGQS